MAQNFGSEWARLQPQPVTGFVTASQSFMLPQQPSTKPRERHKDKLFKFGIVEVIFGIISIISCIVTLVFASIIRTWPYYIPYYDRTDQMEVYYGETKSAPGIWCGAIVLATGILGIKSKSTPTVCMYNANMTMSIIGACFMGILCIMSGYSAGDLYPLSSTYVVLAMHCLMAIVGFAGMIICIIHSAYCCAGVCCHKNPQQGVVVYAAQPQMVQLTNGQYAMISPSVPPNYPTLAGPSYFPAGHVQAPVGTPSMQVVTPPHSELPSQPLSSSKGQEAQMHDYPPSYSSHDQDDAMQNFFH